MFGQILAVYSVDSSIHRHAVPVTVMLLYMLDPPPAGSRRHDDHDTSNQPTALISCGVAFSAAGLSLTPSRGGKIEKISFVLAITTIELFSLPI